jgi:hypothetical protein
MSEQCSNKTVQARSHGSTSVSEQLEELAQMEEESHRVLQTLGCAAPCARVPSIGCLQLCNHEMAGRGREMTTTPLAASDRGLDLKRF